MGNSKVVLSVLTSILSLLMIVLIIFIFLRMGNAAYDLGYRVFTEPALEEAPGQDVTVEFQEKTTALELGSLLEEKRLVENGLLFTIQLQISDYRDKIKAGTYTLNTSQTAKEMMQVMAEEENEETEE
ncbi:MAG: aminodeoxychorismate lyase [Lachnospiraceae bacterium]|nr:aminodeoxychorismate lyase [Lachnospiraceae bacterium]